MWLLVIGNWWGEEMVSPPAFPYLFGVIGRLADYSFSHSSMNCPCQT